MRQLITCIYASLQIITLSAWGQAPDAYVDSLERVLEQTADYHAQIQLLGELSDHYSYSDSAKAIDYALRIKNLAEHRDDMRGVGIAHYRAGGVFFELFQLDSAMRQYEEAIRILAADTSRLAQHTLARAWHNLGSIHQRKGDADTYLGILLHQAIPIQERLGDSIGMGRNFYNIGSIFQNTKDHAKAAEYYQQSIDMLMPYPGVPELPDAHIKIAEIIAISGDSDPVTRRKARIALETAGALLAKHPDVFSSIYYEIGRGQYEELLMDNLEKALDHYLHAARLAEEHQMPRQVASSLSRTHDIYTKQGRHQQAFRVSERVLTDYIAFLTPNDRLTQLRNMRDSQERLGNIAEAFRLQKLHTALNDSLHAAEMAFKVNNLEQKFEATKRANEIAILNQHMQDQELSIQRSRFWAFALGAAILLVVGVSVSGYTLFRKKQLIAAKESELLGQKMDKMKQDEQIRVFSAMLEGQEQERKRLAIDLHDGLGGSLSGIRLTLSKVAHPANGTVPNGELQQIIGRLDESLDELRHIARNMMPETLLKYGLETALGDFCKGVVTDDKVEIVFQPYGLQKEIPQGTQIMIYRIIQELITNAVKHAKANQILVQCLQNGNSLSITVEDDGIGFGAGADEQSAGMGLITIQTRVDYLGGKLDIHSEVGIGTTVNIELTDIHEPTAD